MKGFYFLFILSFLLCSCAARLNPTKKIKKGLGYLIEHPLPGNLEADKDKEPIVINYSDTGNESIIFRNKEYILGESKEIRIPNDRRDSILSVYLYLLSHFDEDIFVTKSIPYELNFVKKRVKHEMFACEFKCFGKDWFCKVYKFKNSFTYFDLNELDSIKSKRLRFGKIVIRKFDY